MEMIPEDNRLRYIKEKQAGRSAKSKYFARVFMENLKTILCILTPLLVVGFIWVKPGFPVFSLSLVTDGIIIIAIFIFSEYLTFDIGVDAGKSDEDYIKAKEKYEELKDKAKKSGLSLLGEFCENVIESEYKATIRSECNKRALKAEDYYKYKSGADPGENKDCFEKLDKIRRIELTPEMLISDGSDSVRGGIKRGADDYIRNHGSVKRFLMISLTAIIAVYPAFSMIENLSFGTVIYTCLKLLFLFIRMYRGYSDGLRAYNTAEVNCLNSKINYLDFYIDYVSNKEIVNPGCENTQMNSQEIVD